MTFPPGKWSPLLVAAQWPDDSDIAALAQGKSNREEIGGRFNDFADSLQRAQADWLVEQRGHTVDDLVATFRAGEAKARTVRERNAVKSRAYASAYDSMLCLRQDLTDLACEGNKNIETIEQSEQPIETKLPLIQTLIAKYQSLATVTAAKYAGNVLDAIQRILDVDGISLGARQFTQAQGADVGQMFRQPENEQDLKDRIKAVFEIQDRSHVFGGGQLLQAAPPASGRGTALASGPAKLHAGADGYLAPKAYQPVAAAGHSAEPARTGQGGRILPAPHTEALMNPFYNTPAGSFTCRPGYPRPAGEPDELALAINHRCSWRSARTVTRGNSPHPKPLPHRTRPELQQRPGIGRATLRCRARGAISPGDDDRTPDFPCRTNDPVRRTQPAGARSGD